MYVRPNYKTKASLKRGLADGHRVVVFSPGIGTPKVGEEAIEGPHYPEAHTWYARVVTKEDNGEVIVVRVKS